MYPGISYEVEVCVTAVLLCKHVLNGCTLTQPHLMVQTVTMWRMMGNLQRGAII